MVVHGEEAAAGMLAVPAAQSARLPGCPVTYPASLHPMHQLQCKDLETQKEVAVKALSLRSLRSWKQLDLFEREAAALKGLRHPGIPQYLGYCEEDTPDDRRFLLIQVGGHAVAEAPSCWGSCVRIQGLL